MDDIFTTVANGSFEGLMNYLQNGGISNLKNAQGTTLLHEAVEENHIGKVKLLLQHNCNINVVNQHGCMPVYAAISKGHNSVLEVLLESGAAVNIVVYQQTTPLIHAVVTENIEAVRLILSNGNEVDINMENYIKQTALTQAIICMNKSLCELLLKNGASVKGIYNRNKITQQAARCMCSDTEIMSLFLNYSRELDLHYHLLVACILRKFDVAELLLLKFEDPFQLKALGFIIKHEDLDVWERLSKSVVKAYSLATKCSKENKLLLMLLGFCSEQHHDNQRRNHRQRAVMLIRVLVKYGLVIHPQTSIKPCQGDCDCRKCIFTALYEMEPVTSLKSQCCSVIRQHVTNRHGKFECGRANSLLLPPSLKKFVCMNDW